MKHLTEVRRSDIVTAAGVVELVDWSWESARGATPQLSGVPNFGSSADQRGAGGHDTPDRCGLRFGERGHIPRETDTISVRDPRRRLRSECYGLSYNAAALFCALQSAYAVADYMPRLAAHLAHMLPYGARVVV